VTAPVIATLLPTRPDRSTFPSVDDDLPAADPHRVADQRDRSSLSVIEGDRIVIQGNASTAGRTYRDTSRDARKIGDDKRMLPGSDECDLTDSGLAGKHYCGNLGR
jgi:hypothetical protein